MIGKSIYVSNLEDMILDENVDFYFTSFHIEEEFNEEYCIKVKELLYKLKDKTVVCDISPRGLKQLNYSSLKEFVLDTKIDILRFDFGYSMEEMLEVSKYCKIGLNASTCDEDMISKFNNCVGIHNFYPRPETGLDIDYFNEQNELFRKYNLPIITFISGDIHLRGPLHSRLVTLEEHRNKSCYEQYLHMKELNVHNIIIADPGISNEQFKLIQDTEKDGVIRLYASLENDTSYLYNRVFTNRKDAPDSLIRVIESRNYATQGRLIKPNNCIERSKGSITIDNENYLRYSGEIQITKKDYKQDDKVNVIGYIKDKNLLKYIKRNKKFMLMK